MGRGIAGKGVVWKGARSGCRGPGPGQVFCRLGGRPVADPCPLPERWGSRGSSLKGGKSWRKCGRGRGLCRDPLHCISKGSRGGLGGIWSLVWCLVQPVPWEWMQLRVQATGGKLESRIREHALRARVSGNCHPLAILSGGAVPWAKPVGSGAQQL